MTIRVPKRLLDEHGGDRRAAALHQLERQILFDHGLSKSAGDKDFLSALENENIRRQECVKDGLPVYGPKKLSPRAFEAVYFPRRALIGRMFAELSEREVRAYYLAHPELFSLPARVEGECRYWSRILCAEQCASCPPDAEFTHVFDSDGAHLDQRLMPEFWMLSRTTEPGRSGVRRSSGETFLFRCLRREMPRLIPYKEAYPVASDRVREARYREYLSRLCDTAEIEFDETRTEQDAF